MQLRVLPRTFVRLGRAYSFAEGESAYLAAPERILNINGFINTNIINNTGIIDNTSIYYNTCITRGNSVFIYFLFLMLIDNL